MFNKKAISPVVATSLLLVVAVVAVVGFQGWYQTFSSNLFVSTEQDSGSLDTYGIEEIIGDTLYLKAGNNLTVESVRIDGNDCNINGTYSGTRGFDISDCLSQTTSATPEIVMVTNDKVLSKSVFLSENVDDSSSVSSLGCSVLPGEWIEVPGDPTLGTNDFCVMKWEAKAYNSSSSSYILDGSNSLTNNWANLNNIEAHSVADARPWVRINFTNAWSACDTLNSDNPSLTGTFRMITNREWMTIARDAENNSNNWNSSVVGDGYIPRGNSGAVSAMNGTNPFSGISYRILELSNGEEIWDLSGNVWQWVDLMEDGSTFPTGNACGSSGWFSFFGNDGQASCTWQNGFDKTGASDTRFEMGPLGNFNANNGVGRIYSLTNTNRVLLRGGSWGTGHDVGLFSTALDIEPSGSGPGVGFRCSYEP